MDKLLTFILLLYIFLQYFRFLPTLYLLSFRFWFAAFICLCFCKYFRRPFWMRSIYVHIYIYIYFFFLVCFIYLVFQGAPPLNIKSLLLCACVCARVLSLWAHFFYLYIYIYIFVFHASSFIIKLLFVCINCFIFMISWSSYLTNRGTVSLDWQLAMY